MKDIIFTYEQDPHTLITLAKSRIQIEKSFLKSRSIKVTTQDTKTTLFVLKTIIECKKDIVINTLKIFLNK